MDIVQDVPTFVELEQSSPIKSEFKMSIAIIQQIQSTLIHQEFWKIVNEELLKLMQQISLKQIQ